MSSSAWGLLEQQLSLLVSMGRRPLLQAKQRDIAPWHATLAETRHQRLLSAPRKTVRPALLALGR